MAENKILYRITVDAKTATGTISNMSGGFKRTQIAVEDLNEVLGEMNGEMSRTTGGIGRTMASLKRQRSNLQINSKEYQNVTKSMRFYQSQMDMSTGATGSASSAAMELGRVLSDAPYGIRGVANNISQFASQMAFAAKSTGSLSLAFKDLWKALMGPLGILIVIQGVIAAFEKASMTKKKVKEETDSLTQSFGLQTTKLLVLKSALDDSNVSLEDKKELVKKASKEFKDLNIEIDENGKLTDASRIAIDEYSVALVKNAKAKAIANLITKEMNKQAQLEVEETGKQLGYFDTLYHAISAKVLGTSKAVSNALEQDGEKRDEAMKKSQERVQKFLKMLKENGLEMAKSLLDTEDKNKRTKKLSPFATPKELEIDIKSAENAIIRYEKKIEDARLKKELNDKLSEAKTEEEKATIRRNYEKDKLINQIKAERKSLKLKKSTEEEVVKTKVANHKAELERKHREFVYSVKLKEKLGEITSKQSSDLISQSDELTNKAMSQADKEAEISVEQIREKYKPLFALFESLAGSRLDALFSMPTKDGGKKDEDSDLEFGIKQYMILQSGLTDFLNGEYDRQLTIEQNKTNAMNNQLRERLNNENLSAEERKNIQLQIARNDEQLRKKQEEIEKKRFKVQKAINIANALVDTYRSGVMAFGSQLVIGDPTSPIRAQIAQGVAIAAGLANVAMIARQKFQSTAGGAPTAGALGGGSGGGDNTREFNFNLAGSTQSNQLTQSIAGQLSQPIQTYVVSSEITTQQQLDLNIANTATIGG